MIADLRLGDVVVAEYAAGCDMPANLGPRPYLHRVRTLGGTVVTDVCPVDHPWHLGFSVALQDVDGWNFWGGPTFVRGRGYVDRDDHGYVEHTGFGDVRDDAFDQRLRWRTARGEALLHEHRRVWARRTARGWELGLTTTLSDITDRTLELGSPATNGRPDAGYGGFFWRLPPTAEPEVFTAAAEGEQDVHGAVARWVAYADRDYTLVLTGTDEATRTDPWFVRVDDYPGIGTQFAPRERVVLAPGAALTRSLRVLVCDGVLDSAEAEAWARAS